MLKTGNFRSIVGRSKKYLSFSAIFATVFIVFSRFEFNKRMPFFSGEDSFYHVGMAKYIFEHGIPHQFPYLFYTILNKNFVDHQLLFHLILIPFIKIFGEITGPKIMIIGFVALSFSLLYLIFKEKNLKFAGFYALAAFFVMPADFYFRMAFIRVEAAALFLMVLSFYLLSKKKYVWLGIVSLLFCWLYAGFFIIPVLVVAYLSAMLLTNQKIDYKLPLAVFVGTLLGIIINPYFPKNINFLMVQIFQTGFGAKPYSGGEWKPYDTWYWFCSSIVPIMIFFGSLLIGLIKKEKSNFKELMVVIFGFFLLALELKSKRYVEYWPFWAVMSGFILAGPYLEEKIINFKKNNGSTSKGISFLMLIILIVAASFLYGSEQMGKGLADTQTPINMDKAKEVHDVLKKDSSSGDIVFTDDWDVFPYYFYLNQKNYYIVGLDPEFMNKYDSGLFEEFASISSGKDSTNLEKIKNDFNAKWVIVASDHPQFKMNLENNSELFKKVFSNGDFTLFQVL